MKKLRIAQIGTLFEPITDSSTNGLSQIVYILTEELVALGHEVTLYAPAGSSTSATLVPLSAFEYASETILGKVITIVAAFQDWESFDIIHDHTRFYSTVFAHLLPIPLVSTVHHPVQSDELHWHHPAEDYKVFFRARWERLLKSVTTVFPSRFQRASFDGEAEVIHNGLPLDKWPAPSPSKGGYLGYLGAINETKGTRQAIEAALSADEQIVVAGTTFGSEAYFEREVEPLIDNDRVKYIGPVNFEQKLGLLTGAKAMLLPIQWDDPLPTVALESLAAGTPIIAWNRASMREIVEDGKSGYLVSSVEEMASRVKDLEQLDYGECRARAERLFDSKKMAENYVALYRRLLKARRG
jgi:glycosyltransferase involved in cell wall biosynthesis